MVNPETLATHDTQGNEKQNKIHIEICAGHAPIYTNKYVLQATECKDNRTWYLYGNCILDKFGNIFLTTGHQSPFPSEV